VSSSTTNVWEDVDDTPGAEDGDTTYGYRQTSIGYHMFTFTAFSITSSSITNVTVGFICRETVADSSIRARLLSGGTGYTGSNKSLTSDYAESTQVWDTNPDTSSAWIESEVEALTQFGFDAQNMAEGEEARCTATRITVNYLD
jgi:hypothetical protein